MIGKSPCVDDVFPPRSCPHKELPLRWRRGGQRFKLGTGPEECTHHAREDPWPGFDHTAVAKNLGLCRDLTVIWYTDTWCFNGIQWWFNGISWDWWWYYPLENIHSLQTGKWPSGNSWFTQLLFAWWILFSQFVMWSRLPGRVYGGFQSIMGDLQARWMVTISWKSNFHGWWLGVPPWLRKPPLIWNISGFGMWME